jgi:hypothetical protein
MARTFKLKKGEVLFEDDKIIISDKAKLQRYMSLFTSGIWLLIGIKYILKSGQSNADSLDYFWIFLGVINLLLFVANLLRSSKSIILVDEVKSLQVKQRLNNIFLDIKLNDHRLRRVSQIEDMEELKKRGFQISMTEENHCYENAVAERVNGILKDEFFLDQIFFNMEHAQKATKNAIEIYNDKRIHLSLQFKTPNYVYYNN